MNDNDFKKIWKDAAYNDRIQLNHQKILTEMNTANQKLDKQIKYRNVVEIVGAIFLMIASSVSFSHRENAIVQFGTALMVLSMLFIVYKLLQVRNKRQANDIALSIKDQLIHRKNYIQQEQALVENVFYWYLLPFIIPMVIKEIGYGNFSLVFDPIIWLITIGIFYYIFQRNREAAKKFDPYIKHLEEAIQQLEQED